MSARRPACPREGEFTAEFILRLHGYLCPGRKPLRLGKYTGWKKVAQALGRDEEISSRTRAYLQEIRKGDPGFAAIQLHANNPAAFPLEWAGRVVLGKPSPTALSYYLQATSSAPKKKEVPAPELWGAAARCALQPQVVARLAVEVAKFLTARGAPRADTPAAADARLARNLRRAAKITSAGVVRFRELMGDLSKVSKMYSWEVALASRAFTDLPEYGKPTATRAALRGAAEIVRKAKL